MNSTRYKKMAKRQEQQAYALRREGKTLRKEEKKKIKSLQKRLDK